MVNSLLLILVAFSLSAHALNQPIVFSVSISPPYVMKSDLELTGIDIDIAKAFAKRLNKTAKFNICPIARCLKSLADGETDMSISLKYTAERAEYLSYLYPHYFTSLEPIVFYLNTNNVKPLSSYQDLYALIIGVERGTLYFEPFDSDNGINKVAVASQQQMVQMLLKNRIDAIVEREETIVPLVSKEIYNNTLIKAQYQVTKRTNGYLVLSKKSQHHPKLTRFSEVLADMKDDGTIKAIFTQYQLPYHE